MDACSKYGAWILQQFLQHAQWVPTPLAHFAEHSSRAVCHGLRRCSEPQLKFDPCEPLLSSSVAAVPPLLYCTADGALCSAHAAAAGSADQVSGWGSAAGGASGLTADVLVRDSCSVNSFDVEPTVGQDIVAVTDYECMLLLHRDAEV